MATSVCCVAVTDKRVSKKAYSMGLGLTMSLLLSFYRIIVTYRIGKHRNKFLNSQRFYFFAIGKIYMKRVICV